MGAQRGKLLLLFAVVAIAGAEVPSAAAHAGACDANDPTQECAEGDRADTGNNAELGELCQDDDENCKAWSRMGECEKNPAYMRYRCRRSCNVCVVSAEFRASGFGEPQLIPGHRESDVKQILEKSAEYMKTVVADAKYDSVRAECRNKEENCSLWALGSGCDDNPKYMKKECCPACQSCDNVLELKEKCAFDPDGKDAIEAGGMDALFERMVRVADDSNWEPTVLSRPKKNAERNADGTFTPMLPCEEDVTNPCRVPNGPWVITLENFVTNEEIASLLKWGAKLGYERSQAGDQILEVRTSSHAWCTDDCYHDPLPQSVRRRIAGVTGISEEHYECLQLLSYGPGTYYRRHNDFIEKHTEQAHGTRLLTFFIYFNEVEEGGGTQFPRLGLKVEPRKGRVLVWPSVLDEDLYKEDKRTEHEAMPVIRGEKYAANAWIHTRDFQTSFRLGCDG